MLGLIRFVAWASCPRRLEATATECDMSARRNFISAAYDGPIKWAIGAQLVAGCLAALALDGGIAARVFCVAATAFWLSVALIVCRRRLQPTRIDLEFICWGFWPILAIATLVQSRA